MLPHAIGDVHNGLLFRIIYESLRKHKIPKKTETHEIYYIEQYTPDDSINDNDNTNNDGDDIDDHTTQIIQSDDDDTSEDSDEDDEKDNSNSDSIDDEEVILSILDQAQTSIQHYNTKEITKIKNLFNKNNNNELISIQETINTQKNHTP